MNVQSNIIKYLIEENPNIKGNNTKICIAYWKYIAKQRGDYFPVEIEKVINDYKPESITRKRREVIESTEEQSKKAFEFNEHYSHRWGIKHKNL